MRLHARSCAAVVVSLLLLADPSGLSRRSPGSLLSPLCLAAVKVVLSRSWSFRMMSIYIDLFCFNSLLWWAITVFLPVWNPDLVF